MSLTIIFRICKQHTHSGVLNLKHPQMQGFIHLHKGAPVAASVLSEPTRTMLWRGTAALQQIARWPTAHFIFHRAGLPEGPAPAPRSKPVIDPDALLRLKCGTVPTQMLTRLRTADWRILDALAAQPHGQTALGLAEHIGLDLATVITYVHTLVTLDVVLVVQPTTHVPQDSTLHLGQQAIA